MQLVKKKSFAIVIAVFLTLSMTASMMLLPNASAHTPAWDIPTYAYINAAPNPVGIGQTILVYMWLDCVYGAAGGTTAAVGTNGATASAALLSNNWRFRNYMLTISAPDGTSTTKTFAVITDPTSSQAYSFTPDQTGTYTFNFTFPGQVYGADGDGYSGSVLINDTYLPSSASTTLTVQQAPVPSATSVTPLPTNYWQEPIYGENPNWYTISSNWLGMGSPVPSGYTSSTVYHGDAIGPLTSHIMWTKQMQNGGIVGGNMFPNAPGVGYFEGSSYSPRFYNPIIMNGYLYYTETASFDGAAAFGSSSTGPTVCVNLRTGEQLWSNPNIPQLSFGYIYNVYNPDQHGVYPPIIVSLVNGAWDLYDGYTGASLFNVTGVPSAAGFFGPSLVNAAAGPSGEQLLYNFANAGTAANPNWYLSEWNSSKLWLYDVNPYTGGGSLSPSIINASNGVLVSQLPIPITGESGTLPNGRFTSVPYGSSLTVNGNIGIAEGQAASSANPTTTYDWNVSVPWVNTMPTPPPSPFGPSAPLSILAVDYNDMMLCLQGSLPTGFGTTGTGTHQSPYTMLAVNLNATKGQIGSVLWSQTYNPPPGNVTLEMGAVDWQTRVFVMSYEETIQWVGYSLDSGKLLWGPTTPETSFDYYGTPGVSILVANLAYGNLYSSSFGGICYSYNDLTGALQWTWGNGSPGSDNSTYAGFTTPYGVYPTFVQSIANGVVYLATDEHTITNPIYKGAQITALNATTGQEIWSLSDYPSEWSTSGSSFVVADGYLTCMNGYNCQIYSIGRGPSALTVSAPSVGVTTATPVTITGTITDISAGTKQSEQAANFPQGVPCASDASMKDWMGYVYQQQPMPTNFTGVPVTINVVDSNGNYRPIGTAISNIYGTYSLTWTPDIPGNFTVIATFAGTQAYYPSSAATAFYASAAASATTSPTSAPTSVADMYFVPAIVGLFVLIIIVLALVVVLMLRKRP